MRHGMIRRGSSIALLAFAMIAGVADGEQRWRVSNASFTLDPHEALAGRLTVQTTSANPQRAIGLSSAEFLVIDEQVLSIGDLEPGGGLSDGQVIRLAEGILLSIDHETVTVTELVISSARDGEAVAESTRSGGARLELRGVRSRIDQRAGGVVVPVLDVAVSSELASLLGDSALAGASIGTGVLRGSVVWDGGDVPLPSLDPSRSSPATSISAGDEVAASATTPDVTFCELYGLTQFGRSGDVVGLALTTTSWNVGNADLTWSASPSPEHPFIVQNLYRIKNDRFEQIGQSWIKHGFFALADQQCLGVTSCSFEDLPGHGEGPYLGMGCTDTYTSGLNALQSGLGPREEVNPWNGAYAGSGTHIQAGHGHSAIAHRLQVHDADLDPAQNLVSRYVAEGYYVHFEDVAPLNNAAWKEITNISGSVGGSWVFSMPAFGTNMEIGFAVDAWEGAEATTLAQEIPVSKATSPDGRCDLRAKATFNGDGTWHYEYAILNIDMDRKGGSFTVPIDPSNTITNIDFHAPESHDESYDNVAWTSSILTDCPVGDRCIHWETVNNPLRWGTVYNFRFAANAPPLLGGGGDARGVTITLGLFEPGAVTSLSGLSVGPALSPLITLAPMETPVPDSLGSQLPKNRFISFVVPSTDAGIETALRVELSSLHHPVLPADAPDFSAFEGQLRYVNLYRDPGTGQPITDCLESAALGTTFKCASLGCEPEYADWATIFGGEVLHVSGAATVPSSTFSISTLGSVCAGQEATCTTVSTSLAVDTGRWGNVDDNLLLNVSDVVGVVDCLMVLPPPFFEPRSLLRGVVPDPFGDTQNVLDVTLTVDALKGLAYPYAGPQVCP